MTALDPAERSERGARLQAELTGAAAPRPTTVFESSWRDFIYAEVWSRPALDLRSRFLIAMSSAANANDADATTRYARGALAGHYLSLPELREAALHTATYSGWTSGAVLDAAITRAAEALSLPPAPFLPLREKPWTAAERHAEGAANFRKHMLFAGPPATAAYFEGGILNFVFGEMWDRPGLDQRSRRWLTLVGVGNSSSSTPIHSHCWTAMASGNATRDEMDEFVLQYAIHAGWPKASVMQSAVMEQADRVAKNLPFEI